MTIVSGEFTEFHAAARSLEGLKNGTVHLCQLKALPHVPPGVELPPTEDGGLVFRTEDFNPESLKDSPCGQDGVASDRPRDEPSSEGLSVTQAQLVTALKLWVAELTKDDKDSEKACKLMD